MKLIARSKYEIATKRDKGVVFSKLKGCLVMAFNKGHCLRLAKTANNIVAVLFRLNVDLFHF